MLFTVGNRFGAIPPAYQIRTGRPIRIEFTVFFFPLSHGVSFTVSVNLSICCFALEVLFSQEGSKTLRQSSMVSFNYRYTISYYSCAERHELRFVLLIYFFFWFDISACKFMHAYFSFIINRVVAKRQYLFDFGFSGMT